MLHGRGGNRDPDQVAFAKKGGAVYAGTLQQAQTLLAGAEGAGELGNKTYQGAANQALNKDLADLARDALDNGKIDNEAVFERAVLRLNQAQQAGEGGRTDRILGVQADATVRNGSVSIAMDVNGSGGKAGVDGAMITFANGRSYTFDNLRDGGGPPKEMAARVAQAGDGGQSNATFDVVGSAAIGHGGSTQIFRAADGPVGAPVIKENGSFDGNSAAVGQFWAPNSVMRQYGLGHEARRDRLNGGSDRAPETAAPPGTPSENR